MRYFAASVLTLSLTNCIAGTSNLPDRPDGGVVLRIDGGALPADAGHPLPGETCDDLRQRFSDRYPSMRACETGADCVPRPGSCGTFLSRCHYALNRASAPELDAFREKLDTLHCRSEGLACEACPPPPAPQCVNGQCELGCEYVCDLNCACEKDERGCDLPRCTAAWPCPNDPRCIVESVPIADTCLIPTLSAGEAGQVVVIVGGGAHQCHTRALPCTARLVDGELLVDPFVTGMPGFFSGVCDAAREPVSCTAPSLPEGTYPVIVNNVNAGYVQVTRGGASVSPRCVGLSNPQPHVTCRLDATENTRATCIPSVLPAGVWSSVPFQHDCIKCYTLPGPCIVRVQDHRVEVTPRLTRCDCGVCGACLDECRPLEMACNLPPLPAGSYKIQVHGGAERGLLVSHDAVPRCR